MTLILHYYKLKRRGTENKAYSAQFTLWRPERKRMGLALQKIRSFEDIIALTIIVYRQRKVLMTLTRQRRFNLLHTGCLFSVTNIVCQIKQWPCITQLTTCQLVTAGLRSRGQWGSAWGSIWESNEEPSYRSADRGEGRRIRACDFTAFPWLTQPSFIQW